MNSLNIPTGANAAFIEAAYETWRQNPDSVDPTWRAFFQGFTLGSNGTTAPAAALDESHPPIIDSLKQSNVHYLVNTYRALGHLQAHLDPLSDAPPAHPKLSIGQFGLTEADLDTSFDVGTYLGGGQMKLHAVVDALRATYCEHIGVEYMHIQDGEVRQWLQDRMEPIRNQPHFSRAEKIRILRRVHKAELFERFLHTKYVGQKRFSLEGGETMIAALDALIEHCPSAGVDEVVMGMAHRGRLNVLTSVMRKSFDLLFEQFSENYIPDAVGGDGDVKYHLGYEAVLQTSSGHQVEVRLAANPSHLEIVDPVVEGKARARQRIRGDTERRRVLPLLIHGDAAFAGQGVVAETMNFSQLAGYRTGGTVHFIVNNQIGFTTDPIDARSTRYCTDVAKMIEAPVFHVNGDDPEVVCMTMQLALDFRERFQRDVVIDMYCYRRHGHNESDEPAFTQPTLYRKIASHEQVSAVLSQKLIAEGTITAEESEAVKAEYTAALEANLEKAKARETTRSAKRLAEMEARKFHGSTAVVQPEYHHQPVPTGVTPEVLAQVVRGLTTVPENFKLNSKIKRFLDHRAQAHTAGGPVDWGFGEALAFGTLLLDGTPVRLSGQDCQRGTFSHRHAVLHDAETHETYTPLVNLAEGQAKFCVYNSLLSEAAVLGFDYGYSLDYPQMLCLWEAQFGDFANGAQVVIDQFIVSGESKWQRASGIVLLLPHGYEGQGPEHSSARLERFLQACAENNIQVANLTTPAQFFHILRRQMKRDFRKPLVVMSPKSLLRHPAATSRIDDFTSGAFQEILDDTVATASRVVLCSGKVYYDLCDYREKNKLTDIALVRVEQLYPLHTERLAEIAQKYADARLVWCQEESQNMGAWSYIAPQLETIFGRKPHYAGRDASASPAVGSLALHKLELQAFLKDALTA
ncbi:2-oxoglutarate dehydrogenase E1 component [Horticoccus luteus]|uniref:oxoglutarate dehydrogenase (succinyl-transferring) n=1 Tax=Horticoccus luteus TaxID=2862869 RepID=A0A8F9TX47_9BACT|nr:2-oxoglutarate dehydrogenase E1 component [Horticoccus luteus]QYM79873.1 2-oxoglutarate dehydrogenase E1 component [Horticoccus luteus]